MQIVHYISRHVCHLPLTLFIFEGEIQIYLVLVPLLVQRWTLVSGSRLV
jgi:hypothetical protein